MRRIGRAQPQRIVYVSCNPQTFAEDIVHLKEFGYESKKQVDMFPQTYCVEVVLLLVRNKQYFQSPLIEIWLNCLDVVNAINSPYRLLHRSEKLLKSLKKN